MSVRSEAACRRSVNEAEEVRVRSPEIFQHSCTDIIRARQESLDMPESTQRGALVADSALRTRVGLG